MTNVSLSFNFYQHTENWKTQ